MTNVRNVIIKITKDGPEDRWLREQDNQSESIRALIKTAIRQVGNVDFKDFLIESAINSGSVKLFNNPKNEEASEEKVSNAKSNMTSAKKRKNNTRKEKDNESEETFDDILNDPGLS